MLGKPGRFGCIGRRDAYSNKMKKALLGVSEKTLADYGAVSRECALEMARGGASVGRRHRVAVTATRDGRRDG
jgi:nicotinamide mononucleotide (NMN) deamidase PncC